MEIRFSLSWCSKWVHTIDSEFELDSFKFGLKKFCCLAFDSTQVDIPNYKACNRPTSICSPKRILIVGTIASAESSHCETLTMHMFFSIPISRTAERRDFYVLQQNSVQKHQQVPGSYSSSALRRIALTSSLSRVRFVPHRVRFGEPIHPHSKLLRLCVV